MQQKTCVIRPASRGHHSNLFSLSFTCEEDSIGLHVIKSFHTQGLMALWICIEDTRLNWGVFKIMTVCTIVRSSSFLSMRCFFKQHASSWSYLLGCINVDSVSFHSRSCRYTQTRKHTSKTLTQCNKQGIIAPPPQAAVTFVMIQPSFKVSQDVSWFVPDKPALWSSRLFKIQTSNLTRCSSKPEICHVSNAWGSDVNLNMLREEEILSVGFSHAL